MVLFFVLGWHWLVIVHFKWHHPVVRFCPFSWYIVKSTTTTALNKLIIKRKNSRVSFNFLLPWSKQNKILWDRKLLQKQGFETIEQFCMFLYFQNNLSPLLIEITISYKANSSYRSCPLFFAVKRVLLQEKL